MALRFLDSFDHYAAAQILTKWSANYIGAGAVQNIVAGGRTGPNRLYMYTLSAAGDRSTWLQQNLTAQGTWVVGFAFMIDLFENCIFLDSLDGGASQGQLRLDNAGTLSLLRSGAVVATSTLMLTIGIWHYIEFKHIIDNVAGLLEVRVDGAVWATFVGDTQATANPTANQIRITCPERVGVPEERRLYWDDIYILDGVDQSIADPNSPPNNDYLGDTQVEALVPNGAGNYTELATLFGAATHWEAEDEVPPDEDTSYVEDAVVDRRDTFAFGNLSVVSATIPGIQILTRARKTAAGAANFARMYRNAGVDNQGADIVLQESYNYHREILGGDPIAAGAWVVANINSLEMGFRVR